MIHKVAPHARDLTHRRYRAKGGKINLIQRNKNRTKSRVRSKAEHPFLVLKRIFGFTKVRYRGIAKNAERLYVACALINMYMLRRPLLRLTT